MRAKKFREFMDALLEADSEDKISLILYDNDGVDLAFQREEITWEDHERLFKLADKVTSALIVKELAEKLREVR